MAIEFECLLQYLHRQMNHESAFEETCFSGSDGGGRQSVVCTLGRPSLVAIEHSTTREAYT